MSFSHTTLQVRARTKTVTRRLGWRNARPGDLVRAIEKGMGLGKGGRAVPICVIRLVDVRLERLDDLVDPARPEYGPAEMALEGFPGMDPQDFLLRFFAGDIDMWEQVTRIQFEYV